MTVKKATPKKKALVKDEQLVCEGCGIVAVIQMPSLTEVTEELICCGKPMKAKRIATKKTQVQRNPRSPKKLQ